MDYTSISCSLTTQALTTGEGGWVTRKEVVSTLATAVVMTVVTDGPVIFTSGPVGGLTSFRMVLYCTLEEENTRNK